MLLSILIRDQSIFLRNRIYATTILEMVSNVQSITSIILKINLLILNASLWRTQILIIQQSDLTLIFPIIDLQREVSAWKRKRLKMYGESKGKQRAVIDAPGKWPEDGTKLKLMIPRRDVDLRYTGVSGCVTAVSLLSRAYISHAEKLNLSP